MSCRENFEQLNEEPDDVRPEADRDFHNDFQRDLRRLVLSQETSAVDQDESRRKCCSNETSDDVPKPAAHADEQPHDSHAEENERSQQQWLDERFDIETHASVGAAHQNAGGGEESQSHRAPSVLFRDGSDSRTDHETGNGYPCQVESESEARARRGVCDKRHRDPADEIEKREHDECAHALE